MLLVPLPGGYLFDLLVRQDPQTQLLFIKIPSITSCEHCSFMKLLVLPSLSTMFCSSLMKVFSQKLQAANFAPPFLGSDEIETVKYCQI